MGMVRPLGNTARRMCANCCCQRKVCCMGGHAVDHLSTCTTYLCIQISRKHHHNPTQKQGLWQLCDNCVRKLGGSSQVVMLPYRDHTSRVAASESSFNSMHWRRHEHFALRARDEQHSGLWPIALLGGQPEVTPSQAVCCSPRTARCALLMSGQLINDAIVEPYD